MDDYLNQEIDVVIKENWERILQKKGIKGSDHFFLLGGDSLLASMLILALSETTKIELVLGDLYDNPTLKELSDLVTKRQQ